MVGSRLRLLSVFLVVAALLWLWPNLVHEPLHALALELQGVDYQIAFDRGWPAHPTITRLGEVGGVAGGLLFLLLPSVFSVLLLLCLIWWAKPSLVTHVALPAYLSFDLIINVVKWRVPTSDFAFFAVLPAPDLLAAGIAFVMVVLAGIVIVRASVLAARGEKLIYVRRPQTTQKCVGGGGR
jgi:hypothetical protein